MHAPRLRPPRARRSVALLLAAAALACAGSSAHAPRHAELLLTGGHVLPLEPDAPPAEALAVADGRILWLGADADAARWRGPATRVIDLAGRTLLPGFADAHLHLHGVADLLAEVDLVGTRSYDAVIERVRAAAAAQPPGAWVVGRGWDQNDWPDPRFPTHAALSAAVPDHPVALARIDGHALLVNAAALRAADLDASTPDPPGGRLLRDAEGALTGVLVDAAMAPVRAVIPEPSPAEQRRRLAAAIPVLHAYGLTSVHDAGVSRDDAARLAALADADVLRLRAHLMLRADALDLEHPGRNPPPRAALDTRGRVSLRAIKAMADGALGSRGAALLQPYADESDQRGLLLLSPAELRRLADFALAHGWQLATHAIGDRANRLVLDAYAAALARHPDAVDPRLRVEHAQVLHADDLPRFAELGVIASVQAQHQTSDAPWAGRRLGPERERLAYAWRSLVDSGVRLAGGSDAPVEVPDPLLAFHAAVTRRDPAGEPPGGWHPEQALTREEALLMLTRWPAHAAFRERELGSLAPGKRADLVVLSGDPLTTPEHALLDLRVELTLFDGEVVYDAAADPDLARRAPVDAAR